MYMNSECYFFKRKNELLQLCQSYNSRCSKDPHSVEWWQNKTERKTKELTLSSPSSNDLITLLLQKYYA